MSTIVCGSGVGGWVGAAVGSIASVGAVVGAGVAAGAQAATKRARATNTEKIEKRFMLYYLQSLYSFCIVYVSYLQHFNYNWQLIAQHESQLRVL
jgi:hypothetical protein